MTSTTVIIRPYLLQAYVAKKTEKNLISVENIMHLQLVYDHSNVSTSMSDNHVAEHQIILFKIRKNYPSIKVKTIVRHV